MNEKFSLLNTRITFINDQKVGKSKIVFKFEEEEEKPSELTLIVPNPYASRSEMIVILQERINEIVRKTENYVEEKRAMIE